MSSCSRCCAGKKIEAIKKYREMHGVGLKDAKEAVEALADEHNIKAAPSGCGAVILLAVGAAAAARWFC